MVQKLSCEEVLSKLYTYLDNEIDAPDECDIDQHLRSCRECFSRVEFEKMLRKKVASAATAEIPEETRGRLESLIKRF